MPAAIPLIVGVAATAALPATFTIFGLSVAASAALVGGFASLLATLAVGALTKPKAPPLASFLESAGAGRTTMVRQPITSHSVGYGRYKTSGPALLIQTQTDDEARANGYVYIAVALVATKIRAIRDVYFNDDFSTASQFTSYSRVTKHLGSTDQVADADFVAEVNGWTSDHRGRGIAYLAIRLKWNATAFPTGIPNIAAIVDACDEIYDPRTETIGFTNNAALCIADWLTKPYGRNLAWSKLDEDALIEAANICDERVRVRSYSISFTAEADDDILTLADGARSLDWGDGVRVTPTDSPAGTLPAGLAEDTTYYVIPVLHNKIKLASSAANAFAGTAINLTTDGTGDFGLTYWDEARYKLNGSYSVDADKDETLDQLRSTMAGHVFPRGAKWFIHAGAAVTPTFDLTADHLAGSLQVEPKRSKRDRINGVRAVYVNPDANWQPEDAPVLAPTAELLEEDAGEELYGDVRSSFVTSARQMARLQKIDLMTNRQQMTAQALFNWHALKIAPLDTGTFTHPRYFDEALFQVVGWALTQEGISLKLQSYSATDYDWDFETEEPNETPRSTVTLPGGGLDVPVVSVTTPTTPDYTLPITWTESINATGYDVEHAVAGSESWVSFGQVTATNATIPFAGATDLRVRSVRSGSFSDWGYNYAPDPPTDAFYASGDVQWTDGVDTDAVQIFGTVDDNLEFRGTVGSGVETFTDAADPHKIRSVNERGNISDLVDALPPP